MFLSSKSIIIVLAMYSLSFMLLVAQYTIADVFGITLTDFYGNPLKANTLSLINTGQNNAIQANSTSTNPAQIVTNIVSTNSNQVIQIIKLCTGTLIFDILFYLGVPAIMVTGLTFAYIIFLMILIASLIFRVTI